MQKSVLTPLLAEPIARLILQEGWKASAVVESGGLATTARARYRPHSLDVLKRAV